MKKRLYRYISIILFITLLCTSCGQIPFTKKDTPSDITSDSQKAPDSKEQVSDKARTCQEAFHQFTSAMFKETLSESVLTVHSILAYPSDYGIDTYNYTLGDIKKDASDKFCSRIEGYINQIKDFNYDYLTDEQKLIYDIMLTDFEDSLALEQYYLFHEYLSPLKGVPSYMPSYLGQFSFNTAQDVKDYIEILKLIPDYYRDIMTFEREKADAGMCIPDFELDKSIDQCNEFIKDIDSNFLITTFNDRINSVTFLSDKEKQSYCSENENLIRNTIIPLYQNLITEISELKGRATVEGGLCAYPNGTEYYELLVRTSTNTDKSVPEIKKMLTDKLQSDLTTLMALFYQDSDLYDKMKTYPIDTSDADTILNYLLERIDNDFPDGFETNYTLNDVPKAVEKYQSPAYYFIPRIDNLTVNNIFINKYSDFADMDLFPVLAHEGFPGHMYQTTYFQNTNPDPIRSIFSYTGYLEGWGLYAELYSYELSGQDETVAKFNQTLSCISYDVCCLTDIGIHYEGWSRQDTIDFVSSLGYNADAGNTIYESLIEDPCSYMPYYIGYLEFMDMRETAKSELGAKFNIKDFHAFLLDIGPAQFEIIRERFDIWLDKQR